MAVFQPGSIKSFLHMSLVQENRMREAVKEQTESASGAKRQGPYRNGDGYFQIGTPKWIVVLLPVPAF